MGGAGKIVEADETYFGEAKEARPSPQRQGRPYKSRKGRGPAGKRAVIALVERGGRARTFHVEHADKATVNQIVVENVAHETRIMTDESRLYRDMAQWLRRPRHRCGTRPANMSATAMASRSTRTRPRVFSASSSAA